MPRDGSGTFTKPFPSVVTNTTISSAVENGTIDDIAQDLNTPRPISVGGTGGTDVNSALTNLSAEKFKQVITNWDSTTWMAGSYYAAATATGTAPVAGHAFAGTVYYANASDFVLHATDLTDPANPVTYTRVMAAGVWSPWTRTGNTGTSGSQIGEYLFDTGTTFPPPAGTVRFNNATQNSTTELFFSHLTVTGVDITTSLPFVLRNGYEIAIQDKADITKYKIFTTIASPVLSGSDIRVLAKLKIAGVDLTALHVLVGTNSGVPVTKKNYIVNGAMMVSQENGSTLGTGSAYYSVDQFGVFLAATIGAYSTGQISSSTPAGSPYRLRVVVTTTDAALAAGKIVHIETRLEGLRVSDLNFGLSTAKTIILQFGVRAPAGTYCVTVLNSVVNRSYVAEYVVAAGEANTDVVKSVVIPGDTTGTWAKDNTAGILVRFGLMAGSNFQQTAGSWGTVNAVGSSNQYNFMSVFGNVFELFDVGMYEGNAAPPFQVPDYGSELALSKRYYQSLLYPDAFITFGTYALAGNAPQTFGTLGTEMRAAPTENIVGTWSVGNCSQPISLLPTKRTFGFYVTVTATAAFSCNNNAAGVGITLNARL